MRACPGKSLFGGFLALVVCIWLASGCKAPTHYAGLPIPFAPETLADSWVGFNERDGTCYKLILRYHAGGVLYSQFEQGRVATNRLSAWSVEGDVLRCQFLREAFATSPAVFTGEIKTTLVSGTLVGVGGWKEKIVFRRKRFLEENLSKLDALQPLE